MFDGNLSNGVWRWKAEHIDEYENWLGGTIKVAATGYGKAEWENFIDFDLRNFSKWTRGYPERIWKCLESGTACFDTIDHSGGPPFSSDDSKGTNATDCQSKRTPSTPSESEPDPGAPAATPDQLLLPAIPMLPREEINDVGRATALRNLADGEYDDKFRSMAARFAADGFTTDDIVLRVGNEFNVEPQPFSLVGTDVTAETWVEGYRRIVDVCRDVLGAELRTVWAPLVHTVQMTSDEVLAHYPGADYAMVGADIYDTAPAYQKQSEAPDGIDYDTASEADRKTVQEYVWKETHLKGNKWGEDGIGLRDLADFAVEVGRPIVVPEWGLVYDDGKWGGGDNPVFIRKLHDWMLENDVPFHAYFETDTPDSAHELAGGEYAFTDAAAAFREAFGAPESSN